MNGFVKDYKISLTGVSIVTEHKDEIDRISIPFHAIVNIRYTEGNVTVTFEEMSTNTKTVRFDSKKEARAFFEEINNEWFNF